MAVSTGVPTQFSDPSHGSPRRRWRRWLLGGIFVVAFAAAALVFWRLPIASAVLRTSLGWAGFSHVSVTVTEFTLSRLRLTGIRLGREMETDTAEIAFDLTRPGGPALTRLSLGRTRIDITDPAGPLRHRLDEPQTAGGAATIRGTLDRVAALPVIEARDLWLRYPLAGHILSISGSVVTKRTDAHGNHARYTIRMAGDLGGTAQTLSIKGTAIVGHLVSLDAGLVSSDEAATGSLRLRVALSETEATISGSAHVNIGHMGKLVGFLPALQGAGGRLSLSVRPLSAVTMALDAPLDRGGLMTALRRAGSDGLSLDATLEGGHHPAGVQAAAATVSAVARNPDMATDGVRVDGRIRLRVGRLRAGGIDLEDMTLQAPVRIDRLNDTIVLTLPDKVQAKAAKVIAGAAGITVAPIALSLSGGRAHAFRFNEAAGQADLGVKLNMGASTLRIAGEGASRLVDLAPVTLRLSGTTDDKGGMSLHLRAPALSATERGDTIVIDDLAATLRRVGNSQTGDLRGRVSLRRAGKPFLAPIGIRSDLSLWRDILTFEGQAAAQGAVLIVKDGRHDLASGKGRAQLALQPFKFGAGQTSFRTLVPGLSDIDIPSGTGGGNARLSWGENGMAGNMAVHLEGVTIAHRNGTTIKGLSVSLRLDRLVPPRSPPGQVIRIDHIAAGVSLDDLNIRFAVTDGPAAGAPTGSPTGPPIGTTKVAIEGLTVKLAGGTLKIPPTVLGSSNSTNRATLDVAGVDLATLLALLGIDGVSGTGRLSGAIPIRQNGQAVGIDGGLLAAAGPGVLKIRSVVVKRALAQGGAQVALMLDALENFHYETLSLKIDKALEGEGRILLSIRGHNPAVRNSQPFVINLNVSGNVDRLAAVAAQALQLPADLVRSMLPKSP